MNPKEAAQSLLKSAQAAKVRFPTIWEESRIMQTCGATIVSPAVFSLWIHLF